MGRTFWNLSSQPGAQPSGLRSASQPSPQRGRGLLQMPPGRLGWRFGRRALRFGEGKGRPLSVGRFARDLPGRHLSLGYPLGNDCRRACSIPRVPPRRRSPPIKGNWQKRGKPKGSIPEISVVVWRSGAALLRRFCDTLPQTLSKTRLLNVEKIQRLGPNNCQTPKPSNKNIETRFNIEEADFFLA